MTFAEELTSQTEKLYQIFSSYPLPAKIEGCPHCVDATDEDLLHKKPLAKLDIDDLDKYVFKALTTWGTLSDFKHFLPRIFELLYGPDRFFWPELIADKLIYANWESWPLAEQQAIQEFLNSWWFFELAELANSNKAGGRLSEILAFIGKLEADLEPYLTEWQTNYLFEGQNLVALASLLADRQNELWQGKGWLQPEQLKQFRKWLSSQPHLTANLENQFFSYTNSDPDTAQIISEALSSLRTM